jgi:tRNA-binding EMAP/Myf-like protein
VRKESRLLCCLILIFFFFSFFFFFFFFARDNEDLRREKYAAQQAAKAPKKEDAAAAAAGAASASAPKDGGKKGGNNNNAKAAAPKKEEAATIGHLDLRVGVVLSAKAHPDGDTLYVEEIDVGEAKPRTIVSGIREHIPLDQVREKENFVFLFVVESEFAVCWIPSFGHVQLEGQAASRRGIQRYDRLRQPRAGRGEEDQARSVAGGFGFVGFFFFAHESAGAGCKTRNAGVVDWRE